MLKQQLAFIRARHPKMYIVVFTVSTVSIVVVGTVSCAFPNWSKGIGLKEWITGRKADETL
jgi:hypothetical protein